jgi:hypothetical protein
MARSAFVAPSRFCFSGPSHIPATGANGGVPSSISFTAIALSLATLFVAALAYDRHTNSVRLNFAFPTLASVLILLGFLLWFLAGAAFFFDRYRLPVLTAFLAFIFVPKM